MPSDLSIAPDLLKKALAISDQDTVEGVIHQALREFIARRSSPELAELFGKLEWAADYDYKAERARPDC